MIDQNERTSTAKSTATGRTGPAKPSADRPAKPAATRPAGPRPGPARSADARPTGGGSTKVKSTGGKPTTAAEIPGAATPAKPASTKRATTTQATMLKAKLAAKASSTAPDGRTDQAPGADGASSGLAQRGRAQLARVANRVKTAIRAVPGVARARWQRVRDDAIARPQRAVTILAVVTLVAALIATVSWFGVHRHGQTVQARLDASVAASRSVPKVMSYHFRSIDRQADETQDLVAGQFKDDYLQLLRGTLTPTVKDKRADVQTAVLKTSVISSGPDEVTLLLFVTQQSDRLGDPDGDQTESVVRVTMDKIDGLWKISELKPV